MYLKQLFKVIENVNTSSFVIVAHNSDMNVDASFHLPDNVTHLWATNINVVDERIHSIPIGLENDIWFKNTKKKEKMEKMLKTSKSGKNLVYMNHNIGTNPEKRAMLYRTHKKKFWVTCVKGKNGKHFDKYLDNIYNHSFVICPEGNGMDTVRTWECLYMNTIPIEKRNINNQFYTDLPICFVDSWKEVTKNFLIKEYMRIKTSNWNMEKLNFEYWKNLILKHART